MTWSWFPCCVLFRDPYPLLRNLNVQRLMKWTMIWMHVHPPTHTHQPHTKKLHKALVPESTVIWWLKFLCFTITSINLARFLLHCSARSEEFLILKAENYVPISFVIYYYLIISLVFLCEQLCMYVLVPWLMFLKLFCDGIIVSRVRSSRRWNGNLIGIVLTVALIWVQHKWIRWCWA